MVALRSGRRDIWKVYTSHTIHQWDLCIHSELADSLQLLRKVMHTFSIYSTDCPKLAKLGLIKVFTKARHCSLWWARWIYSSSCHPVSIALCTYCTVMNAVSLQALDSKISHSLSTGVGRGVSFLGVKELGREANFIHLPMKIELIVFRNVGY